MIIQQDTSGPAFEGLREVSSVEVSVTRRRLLLNQTVTRSWRFSTQGGKSYPVGNLRWLFLKKASDSNSQASKTDNSTFLTFRSLYFSPCPKNKFDLPFCFVRAYIHSYLAIIIVKNH